MPDTDNLLVKRLQSEKNKTLAFFRALSEEDWQRKMYTEGEHWTVRQVFQHLVEAEGSILRLMQHIHSGGEGVPEDFDLDAYNEKKVNETKTLTIEDLLSRFEVNRSKTIQWISGLTGEDLAREGRHPFLGIVPIGSMAKLMYRHTQLHQRDIRRLVQGDN